jgi:phosphoglycerate dehydrogenase-like enzyme
MSKPQVYIFTPVDTSGASHKRLEKAGSELRLGEAGWMSLVEEGQNLFSKLDSQLAALMGVSVRRFPITREVMEAAPELRIIAKYTIGVDDVDVEAATEMGILVTHCPTEANWAGVAEFAMAKILTLLKKVRERDQFMKEGGWRKPELMGTYLGARQDGYEGITIGIVGLGRIGGRLADLLAPWRVNLIAYDPFKDDDKFILHNVQRVDLDELLAQSDVVSLHCTLNSTSEHLFKTQQFKAMKPTAILINTARGEVVDENALFQALDQNEIAAAGIDAFEKEPLSKRSPLLGLGDKILMSPHVSSYNTGGALHAAIPWATDDVILALKGELPKHIYNLDVIERWLERFGGNSLI